MISTQHSHSSGGGAQDQVPDVFCWTKMGTEAGQPLTQILQRKEMERLIGQGTFAWGIGNSLGDATEHAKRMSVTGDLDVLFTPMKSAPKAADVAPGQICLWLSYQTRSGTHAILPEHMLVTSRGGPEKRTHYALLCRSEDPLVAQTKRAVFSASNVRNFASMNPVGASQVTSVVRYIGSAGSDDRDYQVAFRAKLHDEGFVKLVDPVVMDSTLEKLYRRVCDSNTAESWLVATRTLKNAASERNEMILHHQAQEALFS